MIVKIDMIDKLVYYNVIQAEIATLYEMIRSEDTGHIYTAISVLTHRLEEIKQDMSPEEQTYITLKDSV
jgi:hypothetical protein